MRTVPYPSPGGILLEEFLKPMEISQYRLTKEIGVPARRIGEIVAGKRTVTADTGLRLSAFFGTSEGFWTGLLDDYDRAATKIALADTLKKITPWSQRHAAWRPRWATKDGGEDAGVRRSEEVIKREFSSPALLPPSPRAPLTPSPRFLNAGIRRATGSDVQPEIPFTLSAGPQGRSRRVAAAGASTSPLPDARSSMTALRVRLLPQAAPSANGEGQAARFRARPVAVQA